MSANHIVPTPPAFLDPLTEIESSYYYAVPKFFGLNHPNTRWLIAMIRSNKDDRLKHKMETSPGAFKGVYYQLMDHPQLYIPEDVSATPMFKRQAVVYLSPLGMAIYLGNLVFVELMLNYKDVYDDPLCDPCEPQYATHLQDNEVGDFHAFPPFLVMMRRMVFGCAQLLMKAGWDVSKPVAMPMRRKFERRVLYFRDWLEVTLAILAARPMFPLQLLLREMTKGHIYKPLKMPMEKFLPSDPATAEAFGLINVDQLPAGAQMVGVRSLLEMAEYYDRYLQMRSCARQVTALKREATAVGINPEILMIQAQDFDAGALPPPEQTDGSNAAVIGRSVNNSSVAEDLAVFDSQSRHVVLNMNMSAARGKGKGKSDSDPPFASEGCRILHYALMRDPRGKSMKVCIEAFCLLLRRGFFLTPQKLEPESSPARDVRNIATLLLNLIQREQNKVDKIVEKIKSGYKKFAHQEEHKQLENRKTACVLYMNKLIGVLSKFLLESKFLVDFVQAEFPPFTPSSTNFNIDPYVAQKFKEIKFGVIREFNVNKDAWFYLDKEMLRTVSGINEMQLRFKVGEKPINFSKPASGKDKGRNKNRSSMSNTNSCFVSYTRVQRRPKPTIASAGSKTLSTAASNALAAAYTSSATVSTGPLLGGNGGSLIGLPIGTSADSISTETDDIPELPELADIDADFQLVVTPATAAAIATADSLDSDKSQGSSYQTKKLCTPQVELQQSRVISAKSEVVVAEGDSPSRQSTDMEQLLASLCREVDSLFKPIEAASSSNQQWSAAQNEWSALPGWATLSSEGVAAGLNEYSTIEPELAPTPMPTPEPSLVPEATDTAAASVNATVPADNRDPLVSCTKPRSLQRRRRHVAVGQQVQPKLPMKLKQSSVLRLFGR